MICEDETSTNECHLAGFIEDIAFARHFVATCLTPTFPPYGSATDIGYASKKLSIMEGNLASYSLNGWWIDRV